MDAKNVCSFTCSKLSLKKNNKKNTMTKDRQGDPFAWQSKSGVEKFGSPDRGWLTKTSHHMTVHQNINVP